MMYYKSSQELEIILRKFSGKIYVAGAGNTGKIYGEFFNKKEISWNGYLDIRASGQCVCGKPVFPYENIKGEDDIYVVISSTLYMNKIVRQLENIGVDATRILVTNNEDIVVDLLDETDDVYTLLERLKLFQDKYKGNRCFVIGNGPSLSLNDLERLQGEITFATNSVYALYRHTKWRPTYYCVKDAFMIHAISESGILKYLLDNTDAMFTSLVNFQSLCSITEDVRKLYFFREHIGLMGVGNVKFSGNIVKEIYSGGSIIYIMLQLAAYMGFDEMYLLGVDFNFSTERHFNGEVVQKDIINHNAIIEEEEKILYGDIEQLVGYRYLADTDYMLWGYQSAKRYTKSHGIKIYNATRGGKLETFERVDFDSLF